MPRTRSIFFHGLGIALRRFPAFLWTYAFNLGLSLAFCFPLYRQLSGILNHSLASQREASGFDVSVVLNTAMRIRGDHPSDLNAMTSHGSVLAYLLIYFLLVPGTLSIYLRRKPAKLSRLLRHGILHFWRFVRITILTVLAGLVILGPLFVLQRHWAAFIDDRFVGRTSLILTFAGAVVILLIASLLRLYFDLVEVYTVQLGMHNRFSGRPDRRVRRTLGPAFRLLRAHLARAWIVFLVLALAGFASAFLASRIAMHMLAQPRSWMMFLVAQLGLSILLFMRFWQRGAETSLVAQHPIMTDEDSYPAHESSSYKRSIPIATKIPPPPHESSSDHPHHVEMIYNSDPLNAIYPAPLSADDPLVQSGEREQPLATPDPIPNPEPASPSLEEPDPGVFHHEPAHPDSRRERLSQDKDDDHRIG
ncbi:hypothetical protein JAO29_12370 [Edaphobacter sp. HDX4]|uniref:hypothetical protein n=1 Tax=Edaphobacter sp. HDX4 TaxID=2794064 RepID=UPI002FE635C8